MYQPPHHAETRTEIIHALMRAHPLGLLVSNGVDGPTANPIPFLLDAGRDPHGRLRGHLSKANPQWRQIAERPQEQVLVIFQGVDTYITPSWYATKRETGKVVPTWNYAIVQARGHARIIDDRDWLAEQINELTGTHEAGRTDPWHVSDAPEPFIEAQIKGIIGIEIELVSLVGKWKVS
ncbi:MAG: FMN-binding negative transcriptional regulator, partial [Hyphomicrobiales bacterium]|nr:FMN-binding negative transcriptional regulator [Hyphomicrobiales bacterium]